MKHLNKIWLFASVLAVASSCADDSPLEFNVDKPQSIAAQEVINKYQPLKSYVDRNANANFKLGAGASMSEYNAKGVMYRLINSNFDEITLGYEMKHGAVVQSNGGLALDDVNKLISTAKDAGVTVFGHTLCWHANQNATYLNKLIAPLVVTPPAYANSLSVTGLKDGSFTGWGIANSGNGISVASGEGMEVNTNAVKLVAGAASSVATELELVSPNITVVSGHSYKVLVYIRSSEVGEGRISFEGLSNNTPSFDWLNTGKASETFATQKYWQKVECQVKDFTGSTFRIKLDLGYKPNVTYYVDVNNIYVYDTQGQPAIVNLVSNGDFEAGNVAGWGGWGNSATFTVSANGDGYGNSGYCLKVYNPSKTSGYWNVQSSYSFPAALENGQKYTLSFDVKADNTGTIRPEVQSANYSSNGFGSIYLTSSWTHYELAVTVTAADRIRFIISYGEMAGTVYMDNFKIYKTAGATVSKDLNVEKTAAVKAELIGNALDSWISGMVTNCKDYVKAWDVVNEPMSDWPDPSQLKTGIGKTNMASDEFYWQDYLGKDYAVKAFKLARQYGNASDILFVNDYGLEGEDQKKCNGLIQYVNYIESQGAKIDGIGTQMHVTLGVTSMAGIRAMLTNLAATGKLIKISELDMGIRPEGSSVNLKTSELTAEQRQAMADFYQQIVAAYFELVPTAQRYGITVWSPLDSPSTSSWRPSEPIGLWNSAYVRKPAYCGFANGLAGKDVSTGF